ncbi:HET-domain-containing protein [Hyaloscypha variabilis F]|uniref:HET-domain-containing protein n=1 Tax=Hyaloscypha variabilis (strain UAMH 11265 / GT02V1 / F) TaxID=1149755 RepID=A0A2J6RGC0_HYAVF|nr:HET-domain-containing protein [Hyaloscypha variabilis F]
MVQFCYTPLPLETHKDRIRVMELFPGDGDSPIECSILEASLSDPPDYEALSYRWGNVKTQRSISMQGKDFEITQNLYTALRHLRCAKQKRTLWIDAICIDQMNVREKNHQVQLMRDIYKKARRTLIWLGRGTEKIRQGFAIIPKLIHASKEKWSMTECMLDWELISNLPRLWAILENPYFARVWIVQEIVFSTDQLVVCGGLTVSWRDFSAAIVSNSGELYITGEPILDVFWQTFLGGSAHSGLGDRWKRQRATWQRILIGYNYPHGAEENTDSWVARYPVQENRKMFKTKNGYIGLGPREMRAGDRIALFSGGSMPLVMRTKGTALELIGDCYVHGIMYSERYREDQCELLWIV